MTPSVDRLGPLLVFLVLLAAAPACAQEEPLYEGEYVSGFETSSFTPCAPEYEGEQWWLEGQDAETWAQIGERMEPLRPDTAGAGVFVEAFVRVRGEITGRGDYGHVGAYDRRIRVSAVLEVVPPDSASCP